MRRTVGTVLLALALALAAGCGHKNGPGIATAGGGSTASASPTASVDPAEAQRQFARCMREHGVEIPDPDSDDGKGGGPRIEIRASAGSNAGANADAAMEACKKYLPSGSLATPDAASVEKMRQFAECMREHGMDIPDPDPNGGSVLKKSAGSGGDGPRVSPDDPAFKAAMEACQDKLPGKLRQNGGGGGVSIGGAK